MSHDKDQRRWAKEPRKSLAERRAEELAALCETASEQSTESIAQNEKNPRDRLRTLCSLIRGTESLKEYVRELLETSELKGFPEILMIHVENREFGIFDLPVAQEFERLQILINQPAELGKALQSGDATRAVQLRLRIERWKGQFEKLYEESVGHGVSAEALATEIKHQNETGEERKGSLST